MLVNSFNHKRLHYTNHIAHLPLLLSCGEDWPSNWLSTFSTATIMPCRLESSNASESDGYRERGDNARTVRTRRYAVSVCYSRLPASIHNTTLVSTAWWHTYIHTHTSREARMADAAWWRMALSLSTSAHASLYDFFTDARSFSNFLLAVTAACNTHAGNHTHKMPSFTQHHIVTPLYVCTYIHMYRHTSNLPWNKSILEIYVHM